MKEITTFNEYRRPGSKSPGPQSRRRGMAIPLAMAGVFIMSVLVYFFVSYQGNQDAKTFHVVNVEKSKLVAEGSISAAIYLLRTEMNELNTINPFKFIKDLKNILTSADSSWYARLRVPALIAASGTTEGTYTPGTDLELTISPQTVLPDGWFRQTLDMSKLAGVESLVKKMGGDPKKTKVSCEMRVGEMKPIVSDKGYVLWSGTKFDDSLHDYARQLGDKLFDFLGINSLKVDVSLADIVSKIVSTAAPWPLNTLIEMVISSFTDQLKSISLKIDVGAMLKKALESIIDKFHVSDIKPLTGNIVIEKFATMFFKCRVEFVPEGSSVPFITELEASRDVKVIDMAAANPLYSFYWLNSAKAGYGVDDWGSKHNGMFKINNLSLDFGYTGRFNFPDDIVNFFKGTLNSQIIRFPGLCFMGGTEQQKIPTGLNDLLLVYPNYLPIFKLIYGPVGSSQTYMPWTFLPNSPVDASVVTSFMPAPSIGYYGLINLVVTAIDGMLQKPKVRLFGDWCLSPTMKLRIDGNVAKVFKSLKGYIFTIPVPFPPCTLKMGVYRYEDETKGYSYSFYEKPAEAKVDGIIENIYQPDQYKKKASLVYENERAFLKDSSLRDGNNVIKINGVIYIEGDLTLNASQSFYGAGQLVVNGNLTLKGDVFHLPMSNDRFENGGIVHGEGGKIVPFVIVCFKKVTLWPDSQARIMAPVYAKEGIETKGRPAHIIGNLVCDQFDPKLINGDLTIWYTPEVTTCSFMSLIPHVGRFAPDRYRVILAEQFSTFKINRVGE